MHLIVRGSFVPPVLQNVWVRATLERDPHMSALRSNRLHKKAVVINDAAQRHLATRQKSSSWTYMYRCLASIVHQKAEDKYYARTRTFMSRGPGSTSGSQSGLKEAQK
ncbi:hypothetical protein AcV5_002646 [Taiwanofungus camphoratus]|nr:hypothetical protein AcV5_002646 [Antrodia cinnamomea]KAI0918846.1 hypothetical protein AcV7_006960 [Antrodia cinnamomea]